TALFACTCFPIISAARRFVRSGESPYISVIWLLPFGCRIDAKQRVFAKRGKVTMTFRGLVLSISATLGVCNFVFAQSTTGTLIGTVADPGDAAIAGARVELVNSATGVSISTTTGVEGIFRFNSLIPANYRLTVKSSAGFKTYTQEAIDVT